MIDLVLFNLVPQFLYPVVRQYPFDAIVERIVRELEKRNWKVPGITVSFRTYGSGENKYMMAEKIAGENFSLRFGRYQGELDSIHKDEAAVEFVWIPGEEICMLYDGGMSYALYVGTVDESQNWYPDKMCTLTKIKEGPWHSYSYYKTDLGDDKYVTKQFTLPFARIGRNRIPRSIKISEKINKFMAWLQKYALDYIMSFPEAEVIESAFKPEELIPYTGPWEELFAECDNKAASFIIDGKTCLSSMRPEDRHAHIEQRRKLISGISSTDGIPEEYLESYIWCDSDPRPLDGTVCFTKEYVMRIRPKYANQIFVVDDAERDQILDKYHEGEPDLDELSPEEVIRLILERSVPNEAIREADLLRAKTMVPIADYKGGYKSPIILIRRELDFDEIVSVRSIEK